MDKSELLKLASYWRHRVVTQWFDGRYQYKPRALAKEDS